MKDANPPEPIVPDYKARRKLSVAERVEQALTNSPKELITYEGLDMFKGMLLEKYGPVTIRFTWQNVHFEPSITVKFTDLNGNTFSAFSGFIVENAHGKEIFRVQNFINYDFKTVANVKQ